MSHFEDLSPYTYRPDNRGDALNVGWLGETVPQREAPSEAFLDALWQCLEPQFQQLRGIHCCEICPAYARHGPYLVGRHGEQRSLGFYEIRVIGEHGAIYAAPSLIYHYVTAHHYKPPDDFVWGVLHRPRDLAERLRARGVEDHEAVTARLRAAFELERSK